MRKSKPNKLAISNRRAWHDYSLADTYIFGLELTGAETYALRRGRGQLQGAYVNLIDGELWLINALISGSPSAPISESDTTRTRRLLAKRREINALAASKQQGMAIVPLEILTTGRYIKLRVATARGKKKYDKRQSLKKREQERQINRQKV